MLAYPVQLSNNIDNSETIFSALHGLLLSKINSGVMIDIEMDDIRNMNIASSLRPRMILFDMA